MSFKFPEFRIGDAIRHEALAVFPLFAEKSRAVDYDLSHEAMGKGSVLVQEVSASGSVPDLSVENKGELRVLFLEGEQLVGAKQNRILNTSVLVAARTTSKIPVSCVEAGRWHYKSRHFTSGGMHTPYQLRRVLKKSVSDSLKGVEAYYYSDQGAVWHEVARQQKALGAVSPTHAMSDTFEAQRVRLNQFLEKVGHVEGAVGVAVAIAGKVVAIEAFDKPQTCGRVWKRLLSGAVLDALEVPPGAGRAAEAADVERALSGLGALDWQRGPRVGEGEDYRAESPAGDHASALALDGALVHGSVVTAR
jgi:hypothetical protein